MQEKQQSGEQNRTERVNVLQGIEGDAAKAVGGVISQEARDKASAASWNVMAMIAGRAHTEIV